MGLLSNRVERAEIKAGDHVYTWRAVYTYSHHGKKPPPPPPPKDKCLLSRSSMAPSPVCSPDLVKMRTSFCFIPFLFVVLIMQMLYAHKPTGSFFFFFFFFFFYFSWCVYISLSFFFGNVLNENFMMVFVDVMMLSSSGSQKTINAGIYVGGNKVVHFTRKKDSSDMDSSFNSSEFSSKVPSTCPIFPDCGFQQPNSGVVLTCLDCFLDKGSLYCFEYGVAPSVFLAKLRGGTCTTAASDLPETVIHRAMYLLQSGFGNYDVFQNNCEDFAIYCKTGLLTLDKTGPGKSGQASAFINFPLAAALSSPFKLFMASPVGVATVTAGMYCAGRYMTDIGVRKDVIKIEVEDMAANLGLMELQEMEGNEDVALPDEPPLLPMEDESAR